MDERSRLERWMTPTLVVILLVGAILIFLPALISPGTKDNTWLIGLKDFGIALFIASFLGLTIDKLLRKQLAKDAFKASMGYLLPEELRPEMEWVYQQDIIATKHIQKCRLTPLGNSLVIISVTINRTLTNVSNHTAKVKPMLSIDEWFHQERHSNITEFGWETSDGLKCTKNLELERRAYSLHVKEREEDEVSLSPKATVSTWSKYEEIKHINDEHSNTFIYPTNSPFVEVEAFEGIDISVTLTMHKQQSLRQAGHNRYELNGTLLPGQQIVTRWWSIEDSKRWLRENEQQ